MAEHAAQTLFDVVERTAGQVVVNNERLGAKEILARAGHFASGLREHSVGRDDGVVLVDSQGADLLSGLMGAWWLGARPIIAPAGATSTELATLRGQTGAVLTIGAEELASPSYDSMLAHESPEPARQCGSRDVALDLSSSGTTGAPKCVSFTHAALHRNVVAIKDRLSLRNEDVLYTPLPLSIAGVLGMVILPGLAADATVHLGRLEGSRLAHANGQLRQIRPTLLYGVPYMFDFMARHGGDNVGYERLRWAICSSAPLPRATFDRVFERLGVPPRSSYCLAEAGTVTLNTSDQLESLRTSVGEPLEGAEVVIEPFEEGSPQQGGRIIVRGESNGAGYRENGRLTPFTDGAVRTQDRGRFVGAELTVIGRIDEVIQVAGYNVDLAHIREVLQTCPGLGQFTVVVGQHAQLGTVPVLVAETGSLTATHEQILSFCRRELSDVEVPREIRTVTKLGRTATGKVRLADGAAE